jgi:lipoprotein-releasing system permease protein
VAEGAEAPLPKVKVPSLEEAAAALAELELGELPSDDIEARLVEQSEPERAPRVEGVELPGVVVGATLAENLEIKVGDEVKIISPLTGLDTSLWRADGGKPASRDFKVIGVFGAGFQEYDSRLVYMDLYEAQIFQDQGDTVVGVEIRLKDIDQASQVALRLERDLGGGPFHTMDWKELNHNLFTALEMQKVILSVVISVIILVAAFNVIATLIMIVLEKRREVAILKAMGARDGAVLQIFMVQGAAIGVLGTLIGLVLGGGVCAYLSWFEFPLDPKVYLIDHLPVRVSANEFVVTVAIALFISVVATLIPSYWAARLLPADGVRPQ